MQWVVFNRQYIEGILPPGRRAEYNAWLAGQPDNAMRAQLMIEHVVSEFRSGIEANPDNDLDPDLRKIPQSCARHCETICLFDLLLDMGVDMSQEELVAAPTRRDPSFMKTFRLMNRYMVPGAYTRDDGRVEVAKFDWSEDVKVTNSAACVRLNVSGQ